MWSNLVYRISVIKTIIPFALGIKRFIAYSTLAGIAIAITKFIQPHFYKIFIDDIVLGGQSEKMVWVVCGYLGVFCINAGMSYVKNYAKYSIVNNLLLRIKTQLLSTFFSAPLQEYQKTNVGDMKIRLEDDTKQIQEFADKQSVNYAISILTVFLCSILLLVINWKLALFSFVTIPLTVWVDYLLGKREGVLQEENRNNNKDLHNWLQESLDGWREIRALCLEKLQERQYLKHLNRFAMYYSKWINYWTARVLVIPKIRDDFFMEFSLYFLGGLLIIRGEFTIGELLVFASYYKILSSSTRTIASAEGDLVSNKPYSDRLMEVLLKLTADDPKKVYAFTNGDIVFNNVVLGVIVALDEINGLPFI